MRILGLDPGLQTTGYAVLTLGAGVPVISEAGVIRSREPTHKNATLPQRLHVLYSTIVEILEQWAPDSVAVEQLYAHYDHPRTAILMAHARGCLLLAGAQRQIPVISYPSTRIKKLITGHGRASKEQMQYAIMRELRLPKLPEPHDVADALGIALCHAHMLGQHGAMHSSQGINWSALESDDSDIPTDPED
jgi:crossover junction endodeoxyribonuclease RuvC